METIKVNMNPNPLDVQTIHASQNDTEARQWEFELHNNGELIDTSDVKEQLVFKAYKGGTEQLLPENGSVPTTSPFKGDIRYPQGLLTDQEFLYRESPSEEDGIAKFTSIKGNTLGWNQLVPSLSAMQGQNGTLSVADNVATITSSSSTSYLGIATSGSVVVLPKGGHKYLLTVEVNSPKALSSCNLWYGNSITYIQRNIPANTWTKVSTMASYGTPAGQYIQLRAYGSFEQDDTLQVRNWNYFDLTAMGLDSITINEFTSLFPLSYYSYNQGSILSFNGNGIKTVGKNRFNKDAITLNSRIAENGQIYSSSASDLTDYIDVGAFDSANFSWDYSSLSSSDSRAYVKFDMEKNVVGFATYSPTSKSVSIDTSSCFYLRITLDKGMKDVQVENEQKTSYEPYTESTLSLPIEEHFPDGMNRAGRAYDELGENKAVKRTKIINLGSINKSSIIKYTQLGESVGFYRINQTPFEDRAVGADSTGIKGLCSKYEWYGNTTTAGFANVPNKSFGFQSTVTWIFFRDDSYTTIDDFYASLQDVYLCYELATPTETPITTASLVTENAEIPLSNEDGVLIGKCTEQLSENPGFFNAKIKLADADGECYSNKLQLHVERSPQ